MLARAAFRPIHRWPLAPSVGRRACESRSTPGSSVLRRLVCLAAAAGESPHGSPPRPFRTRQFYRAVLDGCRRRHTSLPQRAPSALSTSARQARDRASMTSARVMRTIGSRACFPARRDLVWIGVSGRPCYLSHSAADERARGYVRQRSRRSGRARCRGDVSERARDARGRVSCVRFGTARSELGRLGL